MNKRTKGGSEGGREGGRGEEREELAWLNKARKADRPATSSGGTRQSLWGCCPSWFSSGC